MRTLLYAVLFFMPVTVYADNIMAGFEVGTGKITVNKEYSAENREQKVSSDTIVGFFGYSPVQNLILEANLYGSFSDDEVSENVDTYSVTGAKLLVGYKINIGPRFSITPEIGRVSWTLTTDTDLEDLDDDTETKKRGYDNVAQISAGFAITRSMEIFAVYSDNKFDFGRDRSSRVGMTFNF